MTGADGELRGERGEAGRAPRHVPGIDGIRALAVLAVLVYHLEPRLLPGGFAGVDLFFVISGYVVSLATSTIPARTLGGVALAFYRRRVIRILPAALAFLIAVQLASVWFIPRLTRFDYADVATVLATAGLSNFVLWWTAADYFGAGPELNPVTHTWSLAVEEQFYLLFPAMAVLIWARRRRAGLVLLAGAAALSLVSAAWWTSAAPVFAFYMLPARFWELAAGVLLFAAVGARPPRAALLRLAVLAGPLLLAWAFVAAGAGGFPFPGAIPAVLAGAALIVASVHAPGSLPARVLAWPPLRYVGRISYSLYLWHWGVLVLLRWTWGLETPLQKLAAGALSWALADLSYRWIEQPVRRSRRLAGVSHSRVVLGGIAAIGLAAGAIVALMLARPALTLSVTGDRDVWAAHRPADDARCPVAVIEPGGGRTELIPGCARGAQRLFVIGDSHAMVYRRLLGHLAARDGIASVSLAQTGCPVLPVFAPPPAQARICDRFVAQALAVVAREARPGDVLFLPGLRSPRWRGSIDSPIEPPPPPQAYDEAALAAEAQRLRPLLDRGVRVVLEAPKPTWPLAPQRCSDAFNRANPICRAPPIGHPALARRAAPGRALLARLRALEPRIEVWDPFPLLCAPAACSPWRNRLPLVSDGDHLSGYANDLLTPSFQRLVGRSSEASP